MDKKKSTLHAERIREDPSKLFTCPFCGADISIDDFGDIKLMPNSPNLVFEAACDMCDNCWDLIYSFEGMGIIPELDEMEPSESGNDNIDKVLKTI